MIARLRFRVIVAGLISVVGTQYAWMMPLPYAKLTLAAVAVGCAVVALVLMVVDQ